MSSSDKMFFCYQCNETITISISISIPSSTEPLCPLCNGGFLEEYTDTTNPNPIPIIDFTSSSFLDQSNEQDPTRIIQQLQRLFENLEANPLPQNQGDYYFGRSFDDLIQQLAENYPNRYGTPPASKTAIDALLTVNVTKEVLLSEMNQCAVCMDEFVEGIDVKEMPCKHLYHCECLLPWLELHNSCPVCRYELPTDDVEYESLRRRGEVGESRQTQRSFRMSIPSFWGQDWNSDDGSGSDMDIGQDELD